MLRKADQFETLEAFQANYKLVEADFSPIIVKKNANGSNGGDPAKQSGTSLHDNGGSGSSSSKGAARPAGDAGRGEAHEVAAAALGSYIFLGITAFLIVLGVSILYVSAKYRRAFKKFIKNAFVAVFLILGVTVVKLASVFLDDLPSSSPKKRKNGRWHRFIRLLNMPVQSVWPRLWDELFYGGISWAVALGLWDGLSLSLWWALSGALLTSFIFGFRSILRHVRVGYQIENYSIFIVLRNTAYLLIFGISALIFDQSFQVYMTAMTAIIISYLTHLILRKKFTYDDDHFIRKYGFSDIPAPFKVEVKETMLPNGPSPVLIALSGLSATEEFSLSELSLSLPHHKIVIPQNWRARRTMEDVLRRGSIGKDIVTGEERADLKTILTYRDYILRSTLFLAWLINFYGTRSGQGVDLITHSFAGRIWFTMFNDYYILPGLKGNKRLKKLIQSARQKTAHVLAASIPFKYILTPDDSRNLEKLLEMMSPFANPVFLILQKLLTTKAVKRFVDEGHIRYELYVQLLEYFRRRTISDRTVIRQRYEALWLFKSIMINETEERNILRNIRILQKRGSRIWVTAGDEDKTTPIETNRSFAAILNAHFVGLKGVKHDSIYSPQFNAQVLRDWQGLNGLELNESERRDRLSRPIHLILKDGSYIAPQENALTEEDKGFVKLVNEFKGLVDRAPPLATAKLPSQITFIISSTMSFTAGHLALLLPRSSADHPVIVLNKIMVSNNLEDLILVGRKSKLGVLYNILVSVSARHIYREVRSALDTDRFYDHLDEQNGSTAQPPSGTGIGKVAGIVLLALSPLLMSAKGPGPFSIEPLSIMLFGLLGILATVFVVVRKSKQWEERKLGRYFEALYGDNLEKHLKAREFFLRKGASLFEKIWDGDPFGQKKEIFELADINANILSRVSDIPIVGRRHDAAADAAYLFNSFNPDKPHDQLGQLSRYQTALRYLVNEAPPEFLEEMEIRFSDEGRKILLWLLPKFHQDWWKKDRELPF